METVTPQVVKPPQRGFCLSNVLKLSSPIPLRRKQAAVLSFEKAFHQIAVVDLKDAESSRGIDSLDRKLLSTRRKQAAIESFGLNDSRSQLLRHIQSINQRQGRDSDACMRTMKPMELLLPKIHSNKPRQSIGFKTTISPVHKRESIFKTISNTSKSPIISPSQVDRLRMKEKLLERDFLPKEREELMRSIRAQVSEARLRINEKLERRMRESNKNGIFPADTNHMRKTTQEEAILQDTIGPWMKSYIRQQKNSYASRKSLPLSKEDSITFSSEDQEPQKKSLASDLEEKLVDKLAKAEQLIKAQSDMERIYRYTSEELEDRIKNIKTESLKTVASSPKDSLLLKIKTPAFKSTRR